MNISASIFPIGRAWLGGLSRRPGKTSSFILLSVFMGFAPVLNGLILRSYGYGVQPNWLEGLRMLDFPEILLEVAVIFWARNRRLNFREYWQLVPFYLKVAFLVFISTFWIGAVWSSPIPAISIIRSSYWLIHLGFGVSVYHLVKTENIDVNRYVNWQVVGLAILTIITAAHFIHMMYLPAQYSDQIKWSGALPGCMSVRHFGMLTGSIAALYIGHYCWTAPQNASRWSALIICTWLLGLTIWSGTRGAAVGVAAAFLMIMIATRSLPDPRKIMVLVSALVLGTGLSTFLLPPDSSFGIVRWTDISLSADDLSSGRLTIWYFAWNLFLNHWVFGLGEGAMYAVEITGSGWYHMQPHNAFFQFLYSWGLFGAVAMFAMILGTALFCHRNAAQNPAIIAPLLMADALLVMSLFDGSLFFTRLIMPTVFCLAICLAILTQNKSTVPSGRPDTAI